VRSPLVSMHAYPQGIVWLCIAADQRKHGCQDRGQMHGVATHSG
jgi:hypothetical protein